MALKGKNIVVLSLFRFDAEIESTGMTVARYLSGDNPVYYVDHPFTWKDVIRLRKTDACRRRKPHFSWFGSGVMDTGNPRLKIVIPPVLLSLNFLPEGRLYRRLLRVNEWLIRRRLRRILRKDGVQDFIFINAFDFHYPTVAEGLGAAVTMYYCLDPVAGSFDGRHGPVSERILVSRSDLVVCSSRQLYREKLLLNPRTYFVPNAADVTHAGKAMRPDLAVSPSVATVPGPVIGYFGNIERRIDYPLMGEVIRQNPGFSFVFAGPRTTDVPDWLEALPNVFFTGSVPYGEMPAVIRGFDVALIPFRADAGSAAIFPLKLFEYLGAGKPVVATLFNPDLEEITGPLVTYCTDAAAFSEAIRAALESDSEALRAKRVALAGAHTWESRVQTISELLETALVRKISGKSSEGGFQM